MNNIIKKIVFLPLKGMGGALALLFVCFACSKNDYSSYCPTWYGFSYKTGSYPNYVQGRPGSNIYLNAGDSVHITACQKERGHLINGTFYTWTLCIDTLDTKNTEDPDDDDDDWDDDDSWEDSEDEDDWDDSDDDDWDGDSDDY